MTESYAFCKRTTSAEVIFYPFFWHLCAKDTWGDKTLLAGIHKYLKSHRVLGAVAVSALYGKMHPRHGMMS